LKNHPLTQLAFLLCLHCVFALSARPQETYTTNLVLMAHWDDGTDVSGTVKLANGSGSTSTVIAAATLSNGRASVTESLGTTLYSVTVATSTGTQLLTFPITTALINPQSLRRAELDVVFRKADNSVKSANVSVSMGF
jgi:hypothetical protein